MKSRISSKGQITVPVDVRKKLGLLPGTVVSFEILSDGVLLRKEGPGVHPVDEVFGRLTLKESVDSLLDAIRGPRTGRVALRPRRRRHSPTR